MKYEVNELVYLTKKYRNENPETIDGIYNVREIQRLGKRYLVTNCTNPTITLLVKEGDLVNVM